MKTYVNAKDKLEDTKSSAASFTLVGAAGMILLVLIDLGILPIPLSGDTKILMSIVMGILFFAFLFLGISAIVSLKRARAAVTEENDVRQELTDWFLRECRESLMDLSLDHSFESEPGGDDSQQLYFMRYQWMTEQIHNHAPQLSEEFIDLLAEYLYNQIFPEA